MSRGNAYRGKGDQVHALQDYDQAQTLRPDGAVALNSGG